jgi:hypothetical protein
LPAALLDYAADNAALELEDDSPHTAFYFTVDDGVQLEVLDWGGAGVPLLLIHGLGATAHTRTTSRRCSPRTTVSSRVDAPRHRRLQPAGLRLRQRHAGAGCDTRTRCAEHR